MINNPQELYKTMLKNATVIPESVIKPKFARVYGNEIKVAPLTADYETQQETMWRYLVVRSTVEKTRAKKIKYIPKKYLPKL